MFLNGTIVALFGNVLIACACVIAKKPYINSVIAGMVVKAAVNQKKREDGMIDQFLPVPVGINIAHG